MLDVVIPLSCVALGLCVLKLDAIARDRLWHKRARNPWPRVRVEPHTVIVHPKGWQPENPAFDWKTADDWNKRARTWL